ncbi:MAG: hypothetical protein ABW189_02825 [Rickettsiales bacterium]
MISEEALCRTITNRLYYSAFLMAREAAGISDKTRNVHKLTIDSINEKSPTIGNCLHRLHKLRKEADYDLYEFPKKKAATAKAQADKVMVFLSK